MLHLTREQSEKIAEFIIFNNWDRDKSIVRNDWKIDSESDSQIETIVQVRIHRALQEMVMVGVVGVAITIHPVMQILENVNIVYVSLALQLTRSHGWEVGPNLI